MVCEQIEAYLGCHAFGEVEGPALAEVEAHLADCPRCGSLAAELKGAAKLLGEAALSGPAPVLSPERRTAILKAAEAPPVRPRAARTASAGTAPFLCSRPWRRPCLPTERSPSTPTIDRSS